MRMDDKTARSHALSLVGIQKVWDELAQSPFVQRDLGVPIDRLPDIGEAAVAARSSRAADALALLDRVDTTGFSRDMEMNHEVARSLAQRMSKEAERYWLAFDPLGVGFFALFAPTAYGGGFLLGNVAGMLAKHRFDTRADVDRYLGLIEDYARIIDQMRERTVGQAERGIRMPRAQLAQSIELVMRFRGSTQSLIPADGRLTTIDAKAALATISARVESTAEPALARLFAVLEDAEYHVAAPEVVGIGQYPGGAALYHELVREHTTIEVTPEEVHADGLARLAKVREEMAALLSEIGFRGSPQEYLADIARNPAWRAQDEEAIGAVFRRYIARIEPHLDGVFRFRPQAAYDVAPLPAALAGSMTFGYYDAPGPQQPVGRYLYNSVNLAGGPLSSIASLNYHELAPGHHFHVASQRENEALHPIRANALFNAFNEGWAEYAATLAGELGMYETPEERFGRLVMDAFLTCRLVVDTGMNALGWSLEQARVYMRENAFMPETEINSESIRYSCDIPAQSLAYKLGETFLLDQREAMRAALGERFDIRDFHDVVLKPGALPFSLTARNIEATISALSATSVR